MNELLMHSMIDKMDAVEKKIDQLIEMFRNLPDYGQAFVEIQTSVENLRHDFPKITFPEKEMRELSLNMVTSAAVFKQPVKQEIIHHHHASKLIWMTVALFLLACFMTSGWYITASNLDLYKANDTKYRYLKLQKDKSLVKLLRITDSLHLVYPQMRDSVIAEEDQRQKDFEMMQQAVQMENEAREIKRKIGIKKR